MTVLHITCSMHENVAGDFNLAIYTCFVYYLVDNPELLPPGFECSEGFITATPGYWYGNGLSYVTSCPRSCWIL